MSAIRDRLRPGRAILFVIDLDPVASAFLREIERAVAASERLIGAYVRYPHPVDADADSQSDAVNVICRLQRSLGCPHRRYQLLL